MDSKPDRNRGSLPLDDKRLKFDKKTRTFYTRDPEVAKEIDARYGTKGQDERVRAMVVEVPQSMTKVNEGTRHNHNYFFTVPVLPWKEEEDATKKRKVQKGDKPKHKRAYALREETKAGNRDSDEQSWLEAKAQGKEGW